MVEETLTEKVESCLNNNASGSKVLPRFPNERYCTILNKYGGCPFEGEYEVRDIGTGQYAKLREIYRCLFHETLWSG